MRVSIFLLLAAVIAMSSCAKGNFGTIRQSNEVSTMFREGVVNPDYNYFYSGVGTATKAIIGIDNSYQVVSEFWTPIALNSEYLKNWVIRLDRIRGEVFALPYQNRYRGSYVLDPAGTKIGVWFGRFDWGTFEFPGDRVIVPYVPRLKPGSDPVRLGLWNGDD
jgi:hypothetical protein